MNQQTWGCKGGFSGHNSGISTNIVAEQSTNVYATWKLMAHVLLSLQALDCYFETKQSFL
jgi:hypothetical protein